MAGDSAGGLGVFHNADRLGERLAASAGATLQRYKAAPVSGFFLNHSNVQEANAWGLLSTTDNAERSVPKKIAPCRIFEFVDQTK